MNHDDRLLVGLVWLLRLTCLSGLALFTVMLLVDPAGMQWMLIADGRDARLRRAGQRARALPAPESRWADQRAVKHPERPLAYDFRSTYWNVRSCWSAVKKSALTCETYSL